MGGARGGAESSALDALLRIVAEGRGLSVLVEELAELMGNPVAVSDPLYQVLAHFPQSAHGDRLRRESILNGAVPRRALEDPESHPYFERVQRGRKVVLFPPFPQLGMDHRRLQAPIIGAGQLIGHVTVLEELRPIDDEDPVLLEQGARLLALELMRQQAELQTDHRLIGDFLRELLSDAVVDHPTAARRAAVLGIDTLRPWHLLLAEPDDMPAICAHFQASEPARALAALGDLVRRIARGGGSERSITVPVGGRIVVLCPDEFGTAAGGGARAVADAIRRDIRWACNGCTVSIAIGGMCQRTEDYRPLFVQANRALDIARSLGGADQTLSGEELGAYAVLLKREDLSELIEYSNRLLGPILVYDAEHGSRLEETLHTYLEENGSFRATSRRLFVHLNTLRGRLLRIRTLCGCDLADSRTRLNLRIALDVRRFAATWGSKPAL